MENGVSKRALALAHALAKKSAPKMSEPSELEDEEKPEDLDDISLGLPEDEEPGEVLEPVEDEDHEQRRLRFIKSLMMARRIRR